MKKTNFLALGALVIVACSGLSAVVPSVHAADWQTPLIPVTSDFTLPNGLRVVFSEDHSIPTAAVVLVYDVGARDEQKGRSGFAHLFEHMMFEGSENVGKSDHFKYLEGLGGYVNASTHPDFTNYFEKLPSNQIELALWLESDRMRSLKVTEENFKNQLETVKEEKRQRIDNQPLTPASIRFEELLFDNWANQHAVIGSFADLEASSIEDVRSFFKTYYAPNNAVMAIVGDFDSTQMRKLVEKYFGTIPRNTAPKRPSVAEPVQTAAKYEKVQDKLAKLPAFWMGWKAPAKRDPDYYALLIIEKLLSEGDSSRFYQKMVKGEKVALRADAGLDSRRGPSAFETFVIYKSENQPEKMREIVWSELDKLKTDKISDLELEKAKNQVLRELFSSNTHSSMQRCINRAEKLAEYALFFGDPKLVDADLDAVMKVTSDDIQRAAKKTFTREGLTVIDIEPVASKDTPGAQPKEPAGSKAEPGAKDGASTPKS